MAAPSSSILASGTPDSPCHPQRPWSQHMVLPRYPPGQTGGSVLAAIEREHGHLRCPFCEAYEVERPYLATLRPNSFSSSSFGAPWDRDQPRDTYRGRHSLCDQPPPL